MILKAFPQAGAPPSPKALRTEIYTLSYDRPEFDGDQGKVAEWLYSRVQAWSKSSLCRTTEARFRPTLARWLTEEQYDTPDECWMTKAEIAEVAARAKRADAVQERAALQIQPAPAGLPRSLRMQA